MIIQLIGDDGITDGYMDFAMLPSQVELYDMAPAKDGQALLRVYARGEEKVTDDFREVTEYHEVVAMCRWVRLPRRLEPRLLEEME